MSTKFSVNQRLSGMMLLQYAVWGFWMPVLARYLQASPAEGGLGFTPGQVGWILGLAGSIGAVTAPFVAGQFADRYFASEKFLAVLLVLGGLIKIWTSQQTTFTAWLWLSVLYSVVYTPTLALTNSLAFAHLKEPEREFPFVRVWGTIGWIAASWLFPLVWLLSDVQLQMLPPFYTGIEAADATSRLADALVFSGVTSLGYAAFCFLLPHTPPRRDSVEKLAFAKAFRLFKHRSFTVLVLASLPISVIHQVYFMQTAPFFSDVLGLKDSQIGPAMTIGQFAEIAVMAGVGLMLKKVGVRWIVSIGALAYFLRYAIFATAALPVWLIVSSQFAARLLLRLLLCRRLHLRRSHRRGGCAQLGADRVRHHHPGGWAGARRALSRSSRRMLFTPRRAARLDYSSAVDTRWHVGGARDGHRLRGAVSRRGRRRHGVARGRSRTAS